MGMSIEMSMSIEALLRASVFWLETGRGHICLDMRFSLEFSNELLVLSKVVKLLRGFLA